MKTNNLFTLLTLIFLAIGLGACARQEQPGHVSTASQSANHTAKNDAHAARGHQNSAQNSKPEKPVPAFQSEEGAKTLKPTLKPEIFTGAVRAAYAAVREIPQTIAQLPCYCRCDRSVGHKSLHSCFEDEHGANCGICMNSALMAYKLEKEQKLKPAQIRERLIAQYAGY
jgi:hypothetical protein